MTVIFKCQHAFRTCQFTLYVTVSWIASHRSRDQFSTTNFFGLGLDLDLGLVSCGHVNIRGIYNRLRSDIVMNEYLRTQLHVL